MQSTLVHKGDSQRPCLTNSVSICDILLVDKGKAVDGSFLDFSEALPHNILPENVVQLWDERFTMHWVKNWLNGRAERVVVSGAISGSQPLTIGAPHGSVLGSVLCKILSIICLQESAPFCISKLADDTKLGGAVDSCRVTLETVPGGLKHWTKINDMKFKFKCQILHKISWGRSDWIAAFQKGIWGCWLTLRSTLSQLCQPGRQTASWGTSDTASPASPRGDCPTLLSINVVSPWVLGAVLGPTIHKRCEGPWMHPKQGSKPGERTWSHVL